MCWVEPDYARNRGEEGDREVSPIHLTIENILRVGGGVSIDAKAYVSPTLEDFARLARANGGRLHIRRAEHLVSPTLESIVRLGANQVLLEFTQT